MLILAGNSLSPDGGLPPQCASWLKAADVVIFEEDRGARSALKKAGLQRTYLKWNEHKDPGTWEELTNALTSKKTVLYMSDQGMPGTADPGYKLADFAQINSIPIKVLPGPTSISAAIAAFPKNVRTFFFGGFPPRDKAARKRFLQACSKMGTHCVLMDTPYRLGALLEDIKAVYGGKSKALLAMDIEMESEEFLYKSINELLDKNLGKRLFVIILPSTFERHY